MTMRCTAYAGKRACNVEFRRSELARTVVAEQTSVSHGPRAERQEVTMIRPSTLVHRFFAVAAAATALLLVASSPAAALVPGPDGGGPATQHRVPAPLDTSTDALLWIALAVALAIGVAAVAFAVHSQRRASRPSTRAPATA
jgi:hypothetical protein